MANILITADFGTKGFGIGKYLKWYIEEREKGNWEVVGCPKLYGYKGRSINYRKNKLFSFFSLFFYLIRNRKNIDKILLGSWIPYGPVVLLFSFLFSLKYDVIVYGSELLILNNFRYRIFAMPVLRGANNIIAITNFTSQLLHKYTKLSSKVILYSLSTKTVSQYLSLPLKIITVSRLEKYKGIQNVIEVLSEIKNEEWHYTIVGTGSYEKEIKEKIKQYDLSDKIEMKGFVEDEYLPDLYKKHNVFILLSCPQKNNIEGFGIVYLEAASYGLTVIGTDSGGIPEALNICKNMGVKVFLVPCNNKIYLKKIILDIIDKNK